MNRRTRNKLCIWIMMVGLGNCLVYTVVYAYIGGDANNGEITEDNRFVVRGHYLHGQDGKATEVSYGTWIYSSLHSISIWPTLAAVLIAMLILARPHIIATMREEYFISGPTLVTVSITIIVFVISLSTLWFILDFMADLKVVPVAQIIVVSGLVVGTVAAYLLARRRILTKPR